MFENFIPFVETAWRVFRYILQWLKEVAWPVLKNAAKAVLAVLFLIPEVIPRIVNIPVLINDYTREHPYLCGIPMILQFATRVPSLFMLIVFLLLTIARLIITLLLKVVGFGVAGVRGGSFAAHIQANRYTHGSGGIRAKSTFAKLQSAGTKAGRRGSASVIVLPRSWIDLGVFVTQFVLFLWGIFILHRHFKPLQ
ncbi:hypothetical protein BDY19DRAFT_136797 [Irpex rosettiformis]|uniref:Uncharacterized protein n=1 Tax=Irpex rosettiformis TaxID=378272 RepID=A0ACB8U4M8_9APHY|nr:hypothetical protein BDY19DRAFT_136797 [Irpex rosettiformis]